MTVPQVVHEDLVDIHNRIVSMPFGTPFDELALQRDKRLVEQWTRTNPGLAHATLGYIFALQGREKSMRDHFQQAISLNALFAANYIPVLTHSGHCSEAADLADQYCTNRPLDKVLHYNTIFANLAAGRIHKASAWLDQWHEPTFGKIPDDLAELGPAKAFLAESGITDHEVEYLQKRATDLLREHNLKIITIEIHFHDYEGDPVVNLIYRLKVSVDDVVQLTITHANRIIEKKRTRADEFVHLSLSTSP